MQGLAKSKLTDHAGVRLTGQAVVDHDRSWSVYFSDPFGHRFELTTYDHEETRAALAAL